MVLSHCSRCYYYHYCLILVVQGQEAGSGIYNGTGGDGDARKPFVDVRDSVMWFFFFIAVGKTTVGICVKGGTVLMVLLVLQ